MLMTEKYQNYGRIYAIGSIWILASAAFVKKYTYYYYSRMYSTAVTT